jgi:UDP-N-acetylglucosamine 2-epimerase (non-hydrolysing)
MRTLVVVGTRPEVIKLAPVVRQLGRAGIGEPILVTTGQHRELVRQMLGVFGLAPDVDLDVMTHGQGLADLTSVLTQRLGSLVGEVAPDWVVVQGDTTSALCAALAGFYAGVPVAHVEAGLRTNDVRSPFPEEVNRRLVAPLAELHFCPTPRSVENLLAEGVDADRIHLTGNTVVDSLLWATEQVTGLAPVSAGGRTRRVLVTLHRRENHGPSMRGICEALVLLAARGDTEIVFPVHPNPAVRAVVGDVLQGVDGVHLCEPLDYLTLVATLANCDLVLTDSGGLQEEAPSLGKPVLVLRDTTERPEAIEAGVARLVGTHPGDVHAAASHLLDDRVAYDAMARPANPFGDGSAGQRIVAALAKRHMIAEAA